MKPLKLKPDETKSLASGRVVIWREMKVQPILEEEPSPFDNGVWAGRYREWLDDGEYDVRWSEVDCPYQPGAEFWLTWYSDAIKTGTIVRVLSVSPEKRDTWGWRVELEVVDD